MAIQTLLLTQRRQHHLVRSKMRNLSQCLHEHPNQRHPFLHLSPSLSHILAQFRLTSPRRCLESNMKEAVKRLHPLPHHHDDLIQSSRHHLSVDRLFMGLAHPENPRALSLAAQSALYRVCQTEGKSLLQLAHPRGPLSNNLMKSPPFLTTFLAHRDLAKISRLTQLRY